MNSSLVQLHCSTELELDLLVELMGQYEMNPKQMQKSDNGIDIVLELKDQFDKTQFFSKLTMYDIFYKIIRN